MSDFPCNYALILSNSQFLFKSSTLSCNFSFTSSSAQTNIITRWLSIEREVEGYQVSEAIQLMQLKITEMLYVGLKKPSAYPESGLVFPVYATDLKRV